MSEPTVSPRGRLSTNTEKMSETKTPAVDSETQTASSATPAVSDIQERAKSFNEELTGLLSKYRLALGAEAFIVNGAVQAKPVVVDAPQADGESK